MDDAPLHLTVGIHRPQLLGLAATAVALPLCALIFAFIKFESVTPVTLPFVQGLIVMAGLFVTISILSFIFAAAVYFLYDDADRIRFQVLRGLCCPAYGNLLHLKAGEYLPTIVCRCIDSGIYHLIVRPNSGTAENVAKIAPHISASLKGRYRNYAVTQTDIRVDGDRVTFRLENVTVDRSLTVHSVDELRPGGPTELVVQQGTSIDLTTSGSMLFARKTRSGKTTAIISLLLQVLMAGRDDFGSEVIILDPKRAELSRLFSVITLDENEEATAINHYCRPPRCVSKSGGRCQERNRDDLVNLIESKLRPKRYAIITHDPGEVTANFDYAGLLHKIGLEVEQARAERSMKPTVLLDMLYTGAITKWEVEQKLTGSAYGRYRRQIEDIWSKRLQNLGVSYNNTVKRYEKIQGTTRTNNLSGAASPASQPDAAALFNAMFT